MKIENSGLEEIGIESKCERDDQFDWTRSINVEMSVTSINLKQVIYDVHCMYTKVAGG